MFANAERMRRFLEFVVEYTLRTPEEPLKEMIVGLELYAEGGDFDPRISSVVRVDAARLRTKLREFTEECNRKDSAARATGSATSDCAGGLSFDYECQTRNEARDSGG